MTSQREKSTKSLVLERLGKALGDQGFKRNDNLFNRNSTVYWHVVHLQSSRLNTRHEGHFTVNLGVFVPAIYLSVWEDTLPRWARDVDCAIAARIGSVMPGGILAPLDVRGKARDYWWNYNGAMNGDELGRQIAQDVTTFGVSFIERFASLGAIHDFLQDYIALPVAQPVDHLYFAAAKAELGDHEAARKVILEVYERYLPWRDRADRTARRLGLGSITLP